MAPYTILYLPLVEGNPILNIIRTHFTLVSNATHVTIIWCWGTYFTSFQTRITSFSFSSLIKAQYISFLPKNWRKSTLALPTMTNQNSVTCSMLIGICNWSLKPSFLCLYKPLHNPQFHHFLVEKAELLHRDLDPPNLELLRIFVDVVPCFLHPKGGSCLRTVNIEWFSGEMMLKT